MNFHHFVLANGRDFQPCKAPAQLIKRRGRTGRCFRNAFLLVLEHTEDRPDLSVRNPLDRQSTSKAGRRQFCATMGADGLAGLHNTLISRVLRHAAIYILRRIARRDKRAAGTRSPCLPPFRMNLEPSTSVLGAPRFEYRCGLRSWPRKSGREAG